MFINYFKISLRKIKRHKLFSFVNIFGLSFSLSICIIIIMLLADQFSYDRFNTNNEQIYRINHTRKSMDAIISGMATSPAPLGQELASRFSGIEKYARFYRGFGNDWIKIMEDVNIPISGFYADPEALDLLQYELEYGDPATALVAPYSVVLTKETAERLFNKENPIGQVIEVGNLGSYKVTGVLKKMAGKSHVKFDGLASMSTLESLIKNGTVNEDIHKWGNLSSGWTYIQLAKGKSVAEVESNLATISEEQYGEIDDLDAYFYLQNIRKISPGPLLGNQIGPGIPMIFVYFLLGMAAVIIFSSCFNYTNMSMARSLDRAREVGVRKVFGADKFQIFCQFLTESVLISILAFIFSLGIIIFLRPIFLNLNFSQLLDMDLDQSVIVYIICLLFSMAIGVLAGFLPAIFHSSIQPLQGLQKLAGVKVFSKIKMRNVLIIGQFGISLFLIITVRVIYGQMNYMVDKEYGFDADNIVVIRLNNSDPEKLKNELAKYPEIINVAAASFIPASGTSTGTDISLDHEKRSINFFSVDEGYVDNMGLTLIAGKNFTSLNRNRKMLINEKALELLQISAVTEAIGKEVVFGDSSNYEIIGVVKDYNHETLFSKIQPLALVFDPDNFGIVQARINSNNYEQAIARINKAWTSANPNMKIEYKLMSDEIAFSIDMMFGDLVKIIAFISILAIIIACLGLLGMVVFSTQTRLREVSVRKVLGASILQVVNLLSIGFIKLLALAVLLFLPLTWYINKLWLDFIAFRIEISVGIIFFGVGIIGLLGILVVGSQTWKAANIEPSRILRDE